MLAKRLLKNYNQITTEYAKIGLGATVIWDIADHASIMSSAEKTARDFVRGSRHIITLMTAVSIMRKARVQVREDVF